MREMRLTWGAAVVAKVAGEPITLEQLINEAEKADEPLITKLSSHELSLKRGLGKGQDGTELVTSNRASRA